MRLFLSIQIKKSILKENKLMTNTEISNLKSLMRDFCRNEINHNRCETDTCEFCPMSAAYDKVAESEELNEE